MLRSTDYLKGRFIYGAAPTQDDFYDLIDTAQTTVSKTLSSALQTQGMILFEGLALQIVGGNTYNGIIEANTTASARTYTLPTENVFVSADFGVIGTAGVTANGTLSAGVNIYLEPFTTPGWIKGGNRISVDDRGRLTATTVETVDFGFTYYTSVGSGLNNMTFCHPAMASASRILVHCSGIAPNSNGTLLMRFVTSTSEAIVDTYNSTALRILASAHTNVKGPAITITTTAAVSSTETYFVDATITPIPKSKNAHAEWVVFKATQAGHYAYGQATLVNSADSTVKGVQLKLGDTNTFKKQGIVRIGVL